MATTYSPMPVAGTTFSSNTRTGGSVPATFDAFLYKPTDEGNQLKLTIKLRIKMRQMPPKVLPIELDANKKAFWTSTWTGPDWQRFLRGATTQADMWNNKFWLVPPASFTDFDRSFESTFPGQVWRPNIRCELEVDFDSSEGAHRTIDVANLDMRMLLGGSQGPGTFRSHALLYDSLDIVPWTFPLGTGPGQPRVHYVVAHEIGHAIGLGHIGVIRKTPLCVMAQSLERIGLDHAPNFRGGENSFDRYGANQGSAVVGNIMGAGDAFTVENARPWQWAMMHLRQRTGEMWNAVTTDPGAGNWARK